MIKVLVPDMPTADDLLPYLREIDANRVYVNNGPLVRRLTAKLGALVGNLCTVVSNGTVSMELALRAMSLPRGSQVLVPAVTYVASGQAIVNAGLEPVLCDVDPQTWQLTPQIARDALSRFPKVRAVMPVAAFGLPVQIRPWEVFAYETGLLVLIDAAGAIYGQQASLLPDIAISYSLHATKALGAGEGGLIATTDAVLLHRIEEMANFGAGGTNAKMSEYHAAVALASLARYSPDWRINVLQWYAKRPMPVALQFGQQAGRTLYPVLLPDRSRFAKTVIAELGSRGIEAKQWYRLFLNERVEFKDAPRASSLPMTCDLIDRMLGLPFHAFLSESDVRQVCGALREVIQ